MNSTLYFLFVCAEADWIDKRRKRMLNHFDIKPLLLIILFRFERLSGKHHILF